MSPLNALSVLFASVIVGFLAFAIASAFRDARRPDYETTPVPVRRPCTCFLCTSELVATETVHFEMWEGQFR